MSEKRGRDLLSRDELMAVLASFMAAGMGQWERDGHVCWPEIIDDDGAETAKRMLGGEEAMVRVLDGSFALMLERMGEMTASIECREE